MRRRILASVGVRKTPAIHFEEAENGGRIITRAFGAGCSFSIDLEVLAGSREHLFGTAGTAGNYIRYSYVSGKLPVGTRGIISFDYGGDGFYVDGEKAYSVTVGFSRTLTFGAYQSTTSGNRRNYYLFGCKVFGSDGEVVADFIPSKQGDYAALKDIVTGNVYLSDNINNCKYVEI